MAGRVRPLVMGWREEDTEEALRTAYRQEQRTDVSFRPPSSRYPGVK